MLNTLNWLQRASHVTGLWLPAVSLRETQLENLRHQGSDGELRPQRTAPSQWVPHLGPYSSQACCNLQMARPLHAPLRPMSGPAGLHDGCCV